VTKGVCEDNGGTWYGAGADASLGLPQAGLDYCCQVQWWVVNEEGKAANAVQPESGVAVRNERFELVRNYTRAYVPGSATLSEACADSNRDELYVIDEAAPKPLLDTEDAMLDPAQFTPEQHANYVALSKTLEAILGSQPACAGDGNGDLAVDVHDVIEFGNMRTLSRGRSSWYDIDLDGSIDAADLAIITDNIRRKCAPRK
jgi:hypothetical protein